MLRPQVTVLGCWGLATVGETTSFLIESSEGNILLDMCPGVTRQLKRIDFDVTQLDVAFGSHVHADHLLGATYLVFQWSVESRSTPENLTKPLRFVTPASVKTAIEQTLKLHYPERSFILTFDVIQGKKTSLSVKENIMLRFHATDHVGECYAIRVELLDSHVSIVYTSDGLVNDGIKELARGADLLIGEAFGTLVDYGNTFEKVKHSLGIHLGKLAKEADVTAVLPFHMHPRYDQSGPKKELIQEIRKHYDGRLIWPGDLRSVVL